MSRLYARLIMALLNNTYFLETGNGTDKHSFPYCFSLLVPRKNTFHFFCLIIHELVQRQRDPYV